MAKSPPQVQLTVVPARSGKVQQGEGIEELENSLDGGS
jgi:hypothetical protein